MNSQSSINFLFGFVFIAAILFIIGEILENRKMNQLMERKKVRDNQEQLLKLLKQQESIIEQGSSADMEKLMDINQFMERICIKLISPENSQEKIRTKMFQEEYGSLAIFKSKEQNFSKTLNKQSRESIQELIIAITNHDETKTDPELLNALSTLIQASKHLK